MRRGATRGRKHRSRADVERILGQYDCREQTAIEFARSHGIKPMTLRWWLRRRRKEKHEGARTGSLVPVRIREVAGGHDDRIEIELAGGRKIRVPLRGDVEAVARLAAALERQC